MFSLQFFRDHGYALRVEENRDVRACLSGVLSEVLSAWASTKPLRISYKTTN